MNGTITMDVDLNALRIVATVIECGGFSAAGKVLDIPSSTVSQRVKRLEEGLGFRLLNRTTRSVAWTELGQRLFQEISGPLARIEQAVEQAGTPADVLTGRIRINGPEPAVATRLLPHVLDFVRLHPEVRIELAYDASLIDIVAAGFDAGVRYPERLDQDMVRVSLGPPQRMILVASPAYLVEAGRPEHPRELTAHRAVALRFPRGALQSWALKRNTEVWCHTPEPAFVANSLSARLAAARSGVGLAWVFEETVATELARGELEGVLDAWCPAFPGPVLYYPHARLSSPAFRSFVQHVQRQRS